MMISPGPAIKAPPPPPSPPSPSPAPPQLLSDNPPELRRLESPDPKTARRRDPALPNPADPRRDPRRGTSPDTVFSAAPFDAAPSTTDVRDPAASPPLPPSFPAASLVGLPTLLLLPFEAVKSPPVPASPPPCQGASGIRRGYADEVLPCDNTPAAPSPSSTFTLTEPLMRRSSSPSASRPSKP